MLGERDALDRADSGRIFSGQLQEHFFSRRLPRPHTTVTEPARAPAATESKTIETQTMTARYRERREQSGKDSVSQKSHGLVLSSRTSLYVLALSERFQD